ncbi:hypothetical protein AGMMS50218_16920 [Actinomycetota bacterium]|nr:hypothetical protein AGMMS50218_16920 [Actinomycetota bacterium]
MPEPGHLHASTPAGNRAEWAARRHQPGSPLRDTRGALARARALRAALRAGVPLADVIAAGAPPVDVGQGTLW